jgi:hypothetical protein
LKITREWENKFQIGTKKNRLLGHARIGFLYKSTRFNRTLLGVNRVSEETYAMWTQRAVPEAGDLILAREAPAGNVAIFKEGQKVCLGQRTVHLRPNKTVVDPSSVPTFSHQDYVS